MRLHNSTSYHQTTMIQVQMKMLWPYAAEKNVTFYPGIYNNASVMRVI
jgi:hypothetical protein